MKKTKTKKTRKERTGTAIGPRATGRSQPQTSARGFPAPHEADPWTLSKVQMPGSPHDLLNQNLLGRRVKESLFLKKRDSEDKQNFSRGLVSASREASATPGPLSQGTSAPAHQPGPISLVARSLKGHLPIKGVPRGRPHHPPGLAPHTPRPSALAQLLCLCKVVARDGLPGTRRGADEQPGRGIVPHGTEHGRGERPPAEALTKSYRIGAGYLSLSF